MKLKSAYKSLFNSVDSVSYDDNFLLFLFKSKQKPTPSMRVPTSCKSSDKTQSQQTFLLGNRPIKQRHDLNMTCVKRSAWSCAARVDNAQQHCNCIMSCYSATANGRKDQRMIYIIKRYFDWLAKRY